MSKGEMFYPLHAYVCRSCFLVQIDSFQPSDQIFNSNYAYFSSFSSTWLEHAERYVSSITKRLSLTEHDSVVEIASNDGYLLQFFLQHGIRVLGIEPSANVAQVAESRGIPTRVEFFGRETARKIRESNGCPRLIVANNVFAHVPDLNDFISGLNELMPPDGLATIEFPHFLNLLNYVQFDTIYHEHYSYFSLLAAEAVLARHSLSVIDVDQLTTHGGSLRLYVAKSGVASEGVVRVRELERTAGLDRPETYANFAPRVHGVKRDLVRFLLDRQAEGDKVIGYGAAAKCTTIANFCGIRADTVRYVADASPRKQGQFIPGVRIPIVEPNMIEADRPDFVIIFPWNIADEIMSDLNFIRSWGGRFVVAIPELRVFA